MFTENLKIGDKVIVATNFTKTHGIVTGISSSGRITVTTNGTKLKFNKKGNQINTYGLRKAYLIPVK